MALLHTGERRLAEAGPSDNTWGIDLRASDYRASSPHTWRGSNLLGQTLEHVRTTLCENTPPSADIPLPDIAPPLNQPGDTVFEIDPTTKTRFNTVPITEYSHSTVLSAFMNSAPDDHTPEVLLTNVTRGDQSLMSEQGPDLIGGVVTMDDVTFTTLLSLTSGASATYQFRCRALLDTGSPQSFIHQGAFEKMVATGAADESYVRSTPPRSWSGFDSQEPLNTNRQARLTVQVYHNNTSSASLAVWIYIVPNRTMRCPLLLGRDSWMRFHSRSYQTLAPASDDRVFGELTLSHTFDDAYNSATAYIRSCETTNVVHHLVYDGPGMSLTSSPQLVLVNLTRLKGSPALTGHYMVDITTTHDGQYPSEHFVASGRQTIALTGCRDLEHGDSLGTASASLLIVLLEALTQPIGLSDVTAVSEAPATSAASNTSEQPSTELLHRLDDDQHESCFRLWSTVPHHMRQIDFALDAPGWDPGVIDALSATLKEYADIFSSSKLDYGACSLGPFEIKVPPETYPIQSRTYRLNPVLSKQVDAILDSYLAAGLIQHSTSPWSSPLVCVPKQSGGTRITVNYKKLKKVAEISQIAIPRVDEVDTLGGGSVFSVFDLFSGFTQLTIHPDTIPLTALCTPNGLYEWSRMPQGAAGSLAWFVSVMRLVRDGLDNIRMHLDDTIGSDASSMAHVATLATFFARLRLHNLKLSPNKSQIGAARVDFLGHVISQDGVRPNDDKVAALAHITMPQDIKQLRSLLGGLSYYRKFSPNMAKRVRSITSLLKKRAVFDFTPPMKAAVHALLAELAAPTKLVFPDWDAVIDKSRPSRLHCDASTDGLGATLEQEQPDGSIRPIVYISRATLSNEQNWTPMELEAGCVVWSVRRLRRYLFSAIFLIFTDHECLQQISKIGESKPGIQRWMEFLSAYNYRLSYRRGRDNANADFLPRLPIPPTAEDISGSSALTDPDDLGVYLIRACGYTTPSCPIPGVGLGGLTPPSDDNLGTGWNPSPTWILGGLPLTKDDFRKHRAPMALRRRAGPTADASAYTINGPYLSYAINDQLEPPRPTRAGRTRSRTAILAGHTPLRPDYYRAARSGFAASAAPALPPKTQPCSSPLPQSDRLGSTTPLGRPGLCRPLPTQNPQIDTTPPAPHTYPEDDTYAATKQLSDTLLSYSHREWDKA